MSKKILVIVGMALILGVSGGVIAVSSDKHPAQSNSAETAAPEAYIEYDEDTPDEDIIEDETPDSDVVDDADNEADPEDSSVEEDAEDSDPTEEGGDEEDASEEPADEADADATEGEVTDETYAPGEDRSIAASMSIQYVVDHSTGAQESPRVAFGESYRYCYASFNADRSFEMCVDPSSGVVRRGTYEIYGDIMSVEYSDGGGSEYEMLTDDSGNITHIIVNYGDYDIYFG